MVDDFRTSQNIFEDWQYMDESIIKKNIIGRALTLLRLDVYYNIDHNYLLIDFATFVYIFHNNDKFLIFKKSTRE